MAFYVTFFFTFSVAAMLDTERTCVRRSDAALIKEKGIF